MKSTIEIQAEIEVLSKGLQGLRDAYLEADDYQREKIVANAEIIKRRIKALEISLDMREHKGKRVSV